MARVIPPHRRDPDDSHDSRYYRRGVDDIRNVIVSTEPPVSAEPGALWYNPEGVPEYGVDIGISKDDADGLYASKDEFAAVADVPPRVEAVETQVGHLQDGMIVATSYPGVDPTGTTDSVPGLQAFLNDLSSTKRPGVLPPGLYRADAMLTIPGHVTLSAYGATILNRNLGQYDPVLVAGDTGKVTDITIMGLTVDGGREWVAANKTWGHSEWKHGVAFAHVENVVLRDVTAKNCYGDGFAFNDDAAGVKHNRRVRFDHVRADNNWRQGLSIIDLEDGTFTDCAFTNTNGVAPQAGLDIEPNHATSIVRNLRFVACDFTGNAGAGVTTLIKDASQRGWSFAQCQMTGNGYHGVDAISFHDLTLTECEITDNAQGGVYTGGGGTGLAIRGGAIRRNGLRGVSLVIGSGNTLARVVLDGVKIEDNSQDTPAALDGVRIDGGTITDVRIVRCDITGATHRYGVTTSAALTGLRLIDNNLTGNGTGATILMDTASTREARGNRGYVARASGVSNVANGAAIGTGLASPPTKYGVTPTKPDRIAAITAVSGGNITVSLTDLAGTEVTVAEPVAWWAEV